MQASDFSKKKILIVESLKPSRDVLKQFAMNLQAETIDDTCYVKDVLNKCKERSYDILLLGYDLGENQKNGQQLLEELKTYRLINRNAIVIIVTAETTQAMVLAALEHKPDDYLTKPFTLKELNRRLVRCNKKKETMSPIYHALDVHQPREVISLCDEAIGNNTPYRTECLGIKSLQHFKLKEYNVAEQIYKAHKNTPNCQWATIGLGKIAFEKNEYEMAAKFFKEVIDEYPMYLSSYDWLAQTYMEQNNIAFAEETLEQAIKLSPLSVVRMKNYANVCSLAHKKDKAAYAYEKNYELSSNSIHQHPDNAVLYALAVNDYMQEVSELDRKLLKNKVTKALAESTKTFKRPGYSILSQLLTISLLHKTGEELEAKRMMNTTELMVDKVSQETAPEDLLRMSKLLFELKKRKTAVGVVEKIIAWHPENFVMMTEIDKLYDESTNASERTLAQDALTDALSLYKNHQYDTCIKKLKNVLNTYPRHIGIQMNLIQVLLTKYESSNKERQYLKQASALINKLDYITEGHTAYCRYKQLVDKFNKV